MEKLISSDDLIKLKKKCGQYGCISYSSDTMIVGTFYDLFANLPDIKNLIIYIQFFNNL